jgi:hypothetical protein
MVKNFAKASKDCRIISSYVDQSCTNSTANETVFQQRRAKTTGVKNTSSAVMSYHAMLSKNIAIDIILEGLFKTASILQLFIKLLAYLSNFYAV